MTPMPKKVLFLDGIGCNPTGFKPRFIRDLGYEVAAPMLPDRDLAAAVMIAETACAEFQPDVIVGYSRGGGLALMLCDEHTPRVLIAPALKYVTEGRGFAGRLAILHSATDDSLPLEDVRAHLQRCGLASADLRVVGDDHTMIDAPALAALTEALNDVVSPESV